MRALAIAWLALLLAAIPADASFPGRNGRIVFVTAADPADRRPAQKFRTIRPDGTQERTIARFDEFLDEGTAGVQFSPDGRRLAYHRAAQSVWTMRPGGRGRRLLARDVHSPAWHWSGRRLAVSGVSTGALATLPAGGGAAAPLTERLGITVDTSEWSGATGRIVASVWREDGVSVQLVDPRHGSARVLAEGGRTPAWSPSGRRIAYQDGTNVWAMRADGSRKRRLTAFPDRVELHDVAWSPDGRLIAFARRDDQARMDGDRIWIMRADGGRPRPLSRTHATISQLDWQPR